MSIDKRVPARSDVEVRRIAERTKAEFGVSRRRPVNILRCLEFGSVLTLYGRKKLVFLVVEDLELEGADAKTEFSKGMVTSIIACLYFGLWVPPAPATLHRRARILRQSTKQKSLLRRF